MEFVSKQEGGVNGELILNHPVDCGLAGFEAEMTFSAARYLTKPADPIALESALAAVEMA